MATTTFKPGATANTYTGTSADDIITIDATAAGAAHTINAGAGTDTVIFDGELAAVGGAGIFAGTGSNSFSYGAATFNVGAAEFLTFDNGTVSSAASVNPEQILGDGLKGSITALGGDANPAGGNDFNLNSVLNWNGSAASAAAGTWTIQSIAGQASIAGANISVVDGGVIKGRATVNTNNDGIDVTAENAFHSAIAEIGGKETMEIDVVLKNDLGATFATTLSVDVVGVASAANNTFAGTDAADTIDGLAGNDVLRGQAGADVLFGNDGNDQLWAGAMDDGNDVFVGGKGNDTVGGGVGDDVLVGNSHVSSGANSYGLVTDDGANLIFAGAGDDVIAIGGYDDTANGNGDLTLALAQGGTLLANDFNGAMGGTAWAGEGDDFVYGSASGDDVIGGGAGDDTVMTLGGDNVVYGSTGDDNITGGTGNNIFFGGAGDDVIAGGTGDDVMYGGDGIDTINTGGGDDVVYGGAGVDTITHTVGGDVTISGGEGDDILTGLAGSVDTFVFAAGHGADTIGSFTLGEDFLDMSALGVTSTADLFIETDGTNTTVYYDGGSVDLTGIAAVTDADFIF